MAVTALIIDDNPSSVDVLTVLLRKEGIAARAVLSPYDLPDTLEQIAQVDVVFLDLEMPHHSGLQLVGELQNDPRLERVPIVAYTVHTSEQNECYAAGFHSFLGKPLSVEQFPFQVNRILNGERVWEVS